MTPSAATDRAPVPVVEVIGLVKAFGRGPRATRALDGLDLSVAPGQVLGFLGPNGAGKSTTLRVLLGMLRADSGTARLFGADPWGAVAEHEHLAYVPGDVALWPGLTGGQTLDALASLRARGPSRGRRAELIERFDLDPTKKVRAYSKGNRQKVALIAALETDVDLLILDEPTSGLDPLMEEVFRQCVAEAAARGTAVLLSSHILSEVESLADSVTIIRAGRTVESGSLERIRALARSRISAVVTHDPRGLADGRPSASLAPGVHDLVVAGVEGAWQLSMSVDADHVGEVMGRLVALGLRSVTAAPPSLEEIFLHHYSADDTGPSTGGQEG
ncbi:ABC transporter ATP-binding protein [Actinomyces sp. zg296]|uniref:ABC transporter ATP-binding protein n=1 Tax=Actinomyces sp. zg296 TaxID=2609289 RepID=UPI00135CB77C|nr:ABC transporter ATP-binding protein [Actinomyces sp. zg296]